MTAKQIVMAAAGAASPPTFIASASGVGSAQTLTINTPTGTQDGDLMIAVMSGNIRSADKAFWSGPAGWTEAFDPGEIATATAIYYKIAASEGASHTFTTNANAGISGHILTYRNAKFGLVGAFGTTTTGDPVCPSITLPVSGCVVLAFVAERGGSSTTWTAPSGVGFSALAGDADGVTGSNQVFASSTFGAGATGTQAFTSNATSDGLGVLLFLAPTTWTNPTPTFIGKEFAESATQTNTLTINKPAGTQSGDLMIAVLVNNSNTTWSLSGWTAQVDQSGHMVLTKTAGSSEPASYAFNSTNSNACSGVVLTYRGGVLDAIGTYQSNTGVSVIDPAIPTVTANFSLLLGTASRRAQSATIAAPLGTRHIDNNANNPSFFVGEELINIGTTGTRRFEMGASTQSPTAGLFTIKPA